MANNDQNKAHLERVLFVCGLQNSGKSTLLRNMLGDKRLKGRIEGIRGRISPCELSRERRLVVRLTSPHEYETGLGGFFNKLDTALTPKSNKTFRRLCYASATQPRQSNQIPDLEEICRQLVERYRPERIRVVQLVPDYKERSDGQLDRAQVDRLRDLDVEVITIDARSPNGGVAEANVRVLADFFDFS